MLEMSTFGIFHSGNLTFISSLHKTKFMHNNIVLKYIFLFLSGNELAH